MNAVAWGALGTAGVLVAVAVGLLVWRRHSAEQPDEAVVDLAAAELQAREDDRAFDAIVGHLLLTDPTFADDAARLSRHDDNGPTG